MNHSFVNTESASGTVIPTLFLPGWGFDGRILQLLKPAPAWIYPDTPLDPETIAQDLLHLLAAKSCKKVRLVGWSMGAMLGLGFSAGHADLIESLVLVSLRNHWPGSEISGIRAEFSQNPESFLKDFYRKCFIGDKQAYRNFCTRLEPLYLRDMKKYRERLLRGLDFLGSFTVPGKLPTIPIRQVHGKQDIIAPLAEMPGLQGADTEIVPNAGHAVFLHKDSFVQHELKKQIIQEKFSRAADSYDSYAKVQTEVARRLAKRLSPMRKKQAIKTILEIGCGTGNFTAMLAAEFPAAKIVAFDFSPEMIAKAGHKLKKNNIEFICAEGEEFLRKGADESFDLVVSNGSLQWFTDHDSLFKNIARILLPGGAFLSSVFGPDSLKKMGLGLKTLFHYPGNVAADAFPDINTLQRCLNAYFAAGTVEQALFEKQYDSVHDLLVHIKKTGTGGWHQNGSPALTPAKLKQLDRWFVETYGSCTVAYQVHFLQAIK